MKVKVNDIPIQYNGKRYIAGDEFELTATEHEGIAPHVTVLEEDKSKKAADKSNA
ncbi:hypothetical protein SAMN05444162_0117 [Paenibacillaceae bacterium GAS479]|nr:hypothetical protein SAMN05444162_0117 [Paenibacillaceae bacterium GAS479]